MTILVELNDEDIELEKNEDEYDLKCYGKAIKEYRKNPKTYSLDEIEWELEN